MFPRSAFILVLVFSASVITAPAGAETSMASRFAFRDPMFFLLGEATPSYADEPLTVAKFQVSFRYQLIDFHGDSQPVNEPGRGLNIGYTQTSFWDLSSRSQPFFDTSFKPAFFVLWEDLGNGGLSWTEYLHLEGGYQHHSNGKAIPDSRSIDIFYFKPTFAWRLFESSEFIFAPKVWTYYQWSALNADIADYWGNVDLEFTWRADFGLQLTAHVVPAKVVTTVNVQATYPLNRLWHPLNFYALVDYWDGAGETFLEYDNPSSGFFFGISLVR